MNVYTSYLFAVVVCVGATPPVQRTLVNAAVNGPPAAACLTITMYVPPVFMLVNEKVVFVDSVYSNTFDVLKLIVVLVVVDPVIDVGVQICPFI